MYLAIVKGHAHLCAALLMSHVKSSHKLIVIRRKEIWCVRQVAEQLFEVK